MHVRLILGHVRDKSERLFVDAGRKLVQLFREEIHWARRREGKQKKCFLVIQKY